ncbi:MAG: AAA family ATPase, partial [Thermoanaerobaculia bacterium]
MKIRNVRGFGEVDLDFSRPDGSLAGWTVLAGRNGSGKSTLLKAIALAVVGPQAAQVLSTSFADWVRIDQSEAETRVQMDFSSNDRLEHLDLVAGGASLHWEQSPTEREPILSGNLSTKPYSLLAEKWRDFDCLFIYDPTDFEEVEETAKLLEVFDIRPWMEQRDSPPGRNSLAVLSEIGTKAPAVAVFIGAQGPDYYSNNHNIPLKNLIAALVVSKKPVIPVFLKAAGSKKYLPPVLAGLSYVDLRTDKDPIRRLIFGITGQDPIPKLEYGQIDQGNQQGWFLCGYGPYRRLTGHAVDAQRLMAGPETIARLVSLFREDSSLIESVEWLREVYLQKLEGKRPGAAEIEQITLSFLNDGLLPDDVLVEEVDSEGLWVTQRGIKLPLSELSDGYRTTAALVMDIIHHLYRRSEGLQVEVVPVPDGPYQCILQEGVILIDEVDLHLHVSWQKR